jgi:hypothetical protein
MNRLLRDAAALRDAEGIAPRPARCQAFRPDGLRCRRQAVWSVDDALMCMRCAARRVRRDPSIRALVQLK